MEIIDRAKDFIFECVKSPQTFIRRQIRNVYLISKGFVEDRCLVRSSALAYTTLLSIVPIFAAALLVMKGFGTGGEAEVILQQIQDFIEKVIPPSIMMNGEESLAHILAVKYHEFAGRIDAGKVGGVGVGFLIFTIVSLLLNIEQSMNDIWKVKRRHSILSRFAIFFIILILAPVLMVLALSTGFISHSQYIVSWLAGHVPFEWFAGVVKSNLSPFVLMTIAFTLLYMIMPNTKVKLKYAFFSALIASLLFNLAISSFGYFMVLTGKVKTFQIVYGALAFVPLLLLFIYIIWAITLFGAEMAYAIQSAKIEREVKST